MHYSGHVLVVVVMVVFLVVYRFSFLVLPLVLLPRGLMVHSLGSNGIS